MEAWVDVYPHQVNASVLLLDGKIYNYKIGNHWWERPSEVKMRFSDLPLIEKVRVVVKNTSFTVNNDKEHQEAFEIKAIEWFRNWQISDYRSGVKCY